MLFTHCSEISDMAHGVLSLPWFLISSWICKFCMFTSPSMEVTLGRLSNPPWESAAFVDSPHQERNHPRKLLSSLFSIIASSFLTCHLPLWSLWCALISREQKAHMTGSACAVPPAVLSEIWGDSGGHWGSLWGPSGSPGCLGQEIFEQSCSVPSLSFNLRLGKENLLLLWGRTEFAFNADSLQISCRYPKYWKEQIPWQLKPSVSDNTTDLLLCYYQPVHN